MSCRMQRYLDAINVNGFMVGKTLYGNVDADTAFQYRYRKMMAQVIFHTPACVVGMPMCHHSEIYRLPRVNKKIGRYTINTCLAELYHKLIDNQLSVFRFLAKKISIFVVICCELKKN